MGWGKAQKQVGRFFPLKLEKREREKGEARQGLTKSVPALKRFEADGFLLLMNYRENICTEKVWAIEV